MSDDRGFNRFILGYNPRDQQRFQTFYVTATPDDHGRRVVCQAALFDKDGKQLFDAVSAEATLNVTFPPQEMANETDTVDEGQGLNSRELTLHLGKLALRISG